MKFRTELKNYDSKKVIDYSKRLLCIGSCFAENLHRHLTNLKYHSFLNPCGIAYNPISIANSIYYLLGLLEVKEEDIVEHQKIYAHFDFHSEFSALSPKEVMSNIEHKLHSAQNFTKPDVLVISLGTAYTYFQKSNHEAVNNCHKLPKNHFTKSRLEVNEVVEVLSRSFEELKRVSPSLEIIATVSPVRHLRDGMIENNLSKSTLLLALQQIPEVIYFPSYELLLDDLRDYRFYDRDLVHPSDEAVEYILKFFEGQCFTTEESDLRLAIHSVQRNLRHRPFFSKSDEHQQFLKKLLSQMKTLQDESGVNFSKEISQVTSQIR